ncbi:lachesin-like isoform X4 [Apis cerana]|uniref:lachesin-like isoform X4 n=1 Tax=Apis cerana TaxID=7461 RepID=UPI0007E2B99D|nr:lachesin-like isoform X4 [Apis cerana]
MRVRMVYGLLYGMASRDIALCFFLAAFLYSSFGQAMPKSEIQPEFLALLENHTVIQGRDVSFTCVVNHLQSYKVAWMKSDSKAILAIHTHMVAQNPRLSVTHNGHNTWKLHVTNVQPNDSGTYMCQVNTDPMRSQTGHMTVVIPPDIMDLDDSADLLTAKEKSDLRLRCRATGTPKPVVTWRREDGRNITLRTEHGVQPVKSYEGEQLHLKGILRQEMGSYLCIASNGVPPTVSKRYYVNVRFKPLIKVSNQLVAAPANSDVVLHCYVESWPKALNTWYRDDELHLTRTTSIPIRHNTDFTDKYGSKKQMDKKGKHHGYGREGGSLSKNIGNVGHITPVLKRNISNALTDVTMKKAKVSSYPALAPAPAHSTPTQLSVQNSVTSLRQHSRLNCVGLMFTFLVIVICSS